ncbi:MAG: hypothetical protein DKM22_06805 [Candidatus Melainabacteria bacterium]|nr:MAG: hypothetical protein DKM22_06805 [Candidatus Melainabacteria bacterium]
MSRKSKGKKIKPDEVTNLGFATLARFGNVVKWIPHKTSQQHELLMKLYAEQYPNIIENIKNLVNDIRILIGTFHPLRLLQCCYMKAGLVLIHSINEKISSPNHFTHEDNMILKMTSYIQSMLMSDSTLKEQDLLEISDFNEQNWEQLYSKVSILYEIINLDFHIAHHARNSKIDKDLDDEEEKLYVQAQQIWTNITGKRYYYFEKYYLEQLLSIHNDIFEKTFGITIQNFIDGIDKIGQSIIFELGHVFNNAHKIMDKYPDIDNENVPQDAVDTMTEFYNKFIDFDLFDVGKITNFPVKLLDQLSFAIGEEQDFLNGDYAGTPLNTLSTKIRPFIKIDRKYYCFDQHVLFDNLYRIVKRIILYNNPNYFESWNEKQKIASEQFCLNLFGKILPNAEIFQNIYTRCYINKSDKKDWRENDILIIYDDQLLVIEVKAGAFSPISPTYDFTAFKKSINELLSKPVKQGEKFLETFFKDKTINIYDKDKNKLKTLKHSDYNDITICSVSLDDFTNFTAKSHLLKSLGFQLPKYPVWSLSIDDLLVFSDLFENNPTQFFHFLSNRVGILKTDSDYQNEMDHLGLYFEKNDYSYLIAQENTKISISSFSEQIDNYYQRISPDRILHSEKPNQNIPVRIQEIINCANKSNKKLRRKSIGKILDLDGNQRIDFDQKIEYCLKRQYNTKNITPIQTSIFAFICLQQNMSYNNINEIDIYIYSNMLIMNEPHTILIKAYYDINNKLYDLDFLEYDIENLSKTQIIEIYKFSELIKEKRIENYIMDNNLKKIGRNDRCPCGSGKKYKKCCGFNK